jgi:hypothetical protein
MGAQTSVKYFGIEIFESKPGYSKRTHETAMPRYTKHYTLECATAAHRHQRGPNPIYQGPPTQLAHPPISVASSQEEDIWAMTLVPNPIAQPNFIINDKLDASVANIFAFGAFANKNSGIVYNDLAGSFLFMPLDHSVCFCPIPLQIELHSGRSNQSIG